MVVLFHTVGCNVLSTVLVVFCAKKYIVKGSLRLKAFVRKNQGTWFFEELYWNMLFIRKVAKNMNIDMDLENQIRKNILFRRIVLRRLFNVIIILETGMPLALRGHWKDLSLEGYHGNFLSVVQLVSRNDHVLHQVLEMPKSNAFF